MRRREFAAGCGSTLASLLTMKAATPNAKPTATAVIEGLEISGYRDGSVIAHNAAAKATTLRKVGSGIIRAFEPAGNHVAAVVERHQTTFVALPSLREVAQVNGLFAGIDPTRSMFLVEDREETGAHLRWLRYPSLLQVCRLGAGHTEGIERVQFAPNSRFAVVFFDRHYPLPDDAFPIDPARFERDRTTPFIAELYDLRQCTRIEQFAQRRILSPGGFSANSAYYEIPDPQGWVGATGHRRFDLTSNQWED